MNPLLTFAVIGLATYLLRVSMFLVVGRRPLPTNLEAAMALLGPAAVGSLVGWMLLTGHGSIEVAPLPELVAVIAGFAAVRRTGNVAHACAVGMPVLWIVTAAGI